MKRIKTGDNVKIMTGALKGTIAEVERIAEEVLPEGYAIGWIGQAFQEKRLGSSAATAFIFGIHF